MQLLDVRVIIDGKFYEKFPAYDYLSSPFSCHKNLTNLENGAHNLKITAVCIGLELEEMPWTIRYLPYDVSSDLIVFTVDATSPSVSVLSPENASCELTGNLLDAPLNFTVNEPVSRLTYSLDGQKNVTVAGNTTLANLPYGAHNVTVYATDNVGNIGFETVIFTIAEPQPEPFQTAPIAPTSGALMAILGVGLMVYLKKHKR